MKKKLSNFWYYNKWYILFALMILILIFNFLKENSQLVDPDAVVSFVTMQEVPEQTVEGLRQQLSAIVGDSNGDGAVEIEVNVYHYDGKGGEIDDPDAYSAAAVHLASELEMHLAAFYVTDETELLLERDDLYQAGTWSDYTVLNNLESQQLAQFCIMTFTEGDTQLLDSLK